MMSCSRWPKLAACASRRPEGAGGSHDARSEGQGAGENFAGQWLQLRNLDEAKPDPDRFPDFDDELRHAMKRETELFFEAVVKEDRSILDFLDAKFTYLNDRLGSALRNPGSRRQRVPPCGTNGGSAKRDFDAGEHPDGVFLSESARRP